MKGNFFENIKDKISRATARTDEYESYEEEEYEEEEYSDEQQERAVNDYSSERASRTARSDRQSYASSQSSVSGESYGSSYGSSQSGSAYGSDPSLYNTKSGAAYSRQSSSGSNGSRYEGGNIYRMDPTYNKTPQTISKVLYFSLEGPEDARNVADAMMKKDSIILAEFSKLSELDVARVLSFIDGVRYICKAQIEQLESFQLIVPEFIQLSGDFYSQVLG